MIQSIEEFEVAILNRILAEDEQGFEIDALFLNERTRERLRSHLGFDRMPKDPPYGFVDVWVTSFGPIELRIDPELDDFCYRLRPRTKARDGGAKECAPKGRTGLERVRDGLLFKLENTGSGPEVERLALAVESLTRAIHMAAQTRDPRSAGGRCFASRDRLHD